MQQPFLTPRSPLFPPPPGAISALGAPLVGMAAERWFGFHGVAGGDTGCRSHNTTGRQQGVRVGRAGEGKRLRGVCMSMLGRCTYEHGGEVYS